MAAAGSGTLGPALAETQEVDCKLWGGAAAYKIHKEGDSHGREALPSQPGQDSSPPTATSLWDRAVQGSQDPLGGSFISPSWANRGFLFPTVSNGSSLAFLLWSPTCLTYFKSLSFQPDWL